MHVLAVDDERIGLELLVSAIRKYDSSIEIHAFRNPVKALEFASKQLCDVAFLDVQMFGMTGIELAQRLKVLCPDIHIVFATGFDEYMTDAMALHASGYVAKPITQEKIRIEMEKLDLPDREEPSSGSEEKSERNVYVRCFGSFEVFCNGTVLEFRYARTKELLAYLVDRKGAACTSEELVAALWQGGRHDAYLRNMRRDLTDTLTEAGCAYILTESEDRLAVCPDTFDCDYYTWLKDPGAVLYQGEYMSQYSWAEETNARIGAPRH